jgi:hypothetical protein
MLAGTPPLLTAQKLRALELRGDSSHAYNLREVRAENAAPSERAERAYGQRVADCQPRAPKRAGTGAATWVRL